jgi:hypothetical protein
MVEKIVIGKAEIDITGPGDHLLKNCAKPNHGEGQGEG